MKTHYVLIDYENVHVKALTLLQDRKFQVKVFLGAKNVRLAVDLVIAMKDLGDKAEYIRLETSGANALDFHITYYLGALVAADREGHFHIISKDTGFDPLIKHLQNKNVKCTRSAAIEHMPCFAQPRAAPGPDAQTRKSAGDMKKSATSTIPEPLVANALANLIKRKKARPATLNKLLGTIHAKCGKDVPQHEIAAVLDELIKRGYVTVDGRQVAYHLPDEMHDTCESLGIQQR